VNKLQIAVLVLWVVMGAAACGSSSASADRSGNTESASVVPVEQAGPASVVAGDTGTDAPVVTTSLPAPPPTPAVSSTSLAAGATTTASSTTSPSMTLPTTTSTTLQSETTTTATTAMPPARPRETLIIHGIGDVALDPVYVPTFPSEGYAYAWSGLDGIFRRDDLTVINMECVVSDLGVPEPRAFNFRCDKAALPAALEAGKRCALANKESLVAAGDLVLRAAERGGGELVPVDSEHSAILQCVGSARREEIQRLILTASGGPFRGMSAEDLHRADATMALRHPTWDMGAKITIDSATLANKALEVIEAHFLYSLPYDRIDVVVHPTSIVHSFVEFVDGSVLSQMGQPTMELPILHALTWPRRLPDPVLRGFDPCTASPLAFEPVDEARFPLFRLGVDAGRAGGAAPAVFNAANELAVEAFLKGIVSFTGMARVVEAALEGLAGWSATTLDEVLGADQAARRHAAAEVERMNRA